MLKEMSLVISPNSFTQMLNILTEICCLAFEVTHFKLMNVADGTIVKILILSELFFILFDSNIEEK